MSIKHNIRVITLCLVFGFASLHGIKMRPEEIQELMHQTNQPKIAHSMPDENDAGDRLPEETG